MTTPTAAAAALAAKLLIGEAYPSGHVYVMTFTAYDAEAPTPQNKPALASLPEAVRLACIDAPACGSSDVGRSLRTAKRDKYYASKRPEFYIPGLEGADDSHTVTCKFAYRKNPAYRYADGSTDVFETVNDDCSTEEVIAVYQAATHPKRTPYAVLGAATELSLQDVQVFNLTDQKHPAPARPVSAPERKAIQARKAQIPKGDECTTQPADLDQAKVLMKAKLKGRKTSVRVSFFADPGCAGHLTDVYVLDVLEGDQVLGTFAAAHYHGLI